MSFWNTKLTITQMCAHLFWMKLQHLQGDLVQGLARKPLPKQEGIAEMEICLAAFYHIGAKSIQLKVIYGEAISVEKVVEK